MGKFLMKLCDSKGSYELYFNGRTVSIKQAIEQFKADNLEYTDGNILVIFRKNGVESILYRSGRAVIKTGSKDKAESIAEYLARMVDKQ